MRVAEFDFELPEARIAQHPADRRDASRLMIVPSDAGRVEHRRFSDLPGILRPGDLLILNDTRVLPARLYGRKASGGRAELLLLERESGSGAREIWRCWLRARRAPAEGARLFFPGRMTGTVLGRRGQEWRVALDAGSGEIGPLIDRHGRMPLPPYIHRDADAPPSVRDRERYQTVYARRNGAIAAPTAGLHFTRELLADIEAAGIEIAFLTLHVGAGTFEPVRAERVADHRMHAERFVLSDGTAEAVERARERRGRVVAVGTTVVRTLEFQATGDGRVEAGRGECDLFIVPGYRFRVVDAMVTNFHLPRSTLIMMVSAFAGRERILASYREAIEEGYRFYSYGDAMFLERSE